MVEMPQDSAVKPEDTFFSDNFCRRNQGRKVFIFTGAIIAVFCIVGALYAFSWRVPRQFPMGSFFVVREGMTLNEAAVSLESRAFIRSEFWFKAFGILWGGERGLKAGEYYFKTPISASRVAWRLTHGTYELVPIRITIPEGSNNYQIASFLKKALPVFNEKLFLKEARSKEGFLFPDTYLFLPSLNEGNIIKAMEAVFKKRIAIIQEELDSFKKPLADVVIMASLLEKEARTTETRQKISGILWKRLAEGMPLQVDAVFPYIFNGEPYDLTDGDLLIDSPYNTYKYAGLPLGPITNPGLDAIRAAIMPIKTPYFYYLSDKNGNMHYAVTHEGHLINRERYLR